MKPRSRENGCRGGAGGSTSEESEACLLEEIRSAFAHHMALRFLHALSSRPGEKTELPEEKPLFPPPPFQEEPGDSASVRELVAAYNADPAFRGKPYQFIAAGLFLDYLKSVGRGDFDTLKRRFSEKLGLLVDAYYRGTSRVTEQDLALLREELDRITLEYYRVSGHIRAGHIRIEPSLSGKEDLARVWGPVPDLERRIQRLERLARSKVPILITGETGTGKTYLARRIHQLSLRSRRRCLIVNCAAIPSTLFQSELFGYKKGAFTGAVRDKLGLLAAAQGGTVFLDEIGDLALEDQVKLLRVLESGKVIPLGGLQEISIDVRFLAGTNRPIEEDVQSGRFRKDLYYRIKGAHLHVPPLRERIEVLPGLCREILARISEQEGLPGIRLTHRALACLQAYPWPGNIRELENVLLSAAALAYPGDIRVSHLPPEVRRTSTGEEETDEAYWLQCSLKRAGITEPGLLDFLAESQGISFTIADLACCEEPPASAKGVLPESTKRRLRRMVSRLKDEEVIEDNGRKGRAIRYRIRGTMLLSLFREAMEKIDRIVAEAGLPRWISFSLYDRIREQGEDAIRPAVLAETTGLNRETCRRLAHELRLRGVLECLPAPARVEGLPGAPFFD